VGHVTSAWRLKEAALEALQVGYRPPTRRLGKFPQQVVFQRIRESGTPEMAEKKIGSEFIS